MVGKHLPIWLTLLTLCLAPASHLGLAPPHAVSTPPPTQLQLVPPSAWPRLLGNEAFPILRTFLNLKNRKPKKKVSFQLLLEHVLIILHPQNIDTVHNAPSNSPITSAPHHIFNPPLFISRLACLHITTLSPLSIPKILDLECTVRNVIKIPLFSPNFSFLWLHRPQTKHLTRQGSIWRYSKCSKRYWSKLYSTTSLYSGPKSPSLSQYSKPGGLSTQSPRPASWWTIWSPSSSVKSTASSSL